jgi:hypothetical protein
LPTSALKEAKMDISATSASISAVFLRRLTTYILKDFKVAKMDSFLSDALFKSFSSKYVYFKIHDANIA